MTELCDACENLFCCHEPLRNYSECCTYFRGEPPEGHIKDPAGFPVTAKLHYQNYRGHIAYITLGRRRVWLTERDLRDG